MDKGSIVKVIKEGHEDYGKSFTVISPQGNPDYTDYIGNHILVEDKNRNRRVLFENEYKLINDKEIDKFDIVTLLHRDSHTRRLFYRVIQVDDESVYIIDDFNIKRKYFLDDVEKASMDKCLEYIDELQDTLYKTMFVLEEMSQIVSNDIKNGIDKLY